MYFNFPQILIKIFDLVPQTTQQICRGVCKQWNSIILYNFPVQLTITNDNYELMFRCPVANKVELVDFTADISIEPAFSDQLQKVVVCGSLITLNLLNFLSTCPEIESLLFKRLSQVISIQSSDVVELPKLKTVEIELNPQHETFTSDEIFVWSFLKQVNSKALESILISGSPSSEWSDNDDEDDDDEFDNGDQGLSNLSSNARVEGEASSIPYFLPTTLPHVVTININRGPAMVDEGVGTDSPPPEESVALFPMPSIRPILLPQRLDADVSGNNSVQPQGIPVEVTMETSVPSGILEGNSLDDIRYRISENVSEAENESIDDDEAQTMESSADMVSNTLFRPSIEFAIRLFRANAPGNESSSHSMVNRNPFLPQVSMRRSNFRVNVANIPSAIQHTVFFEFMYQNHTSLKSFKVEARPDFLCFGHISHPLADLVKLQFEELEYSFGRSHLAMEYKLLIAQKKLRTIKINIMDDMWDFLIQAVNQSSNTLEDFDAKLLSISEEPIDFSGFQGCQNLKFFKCIYFYEKTGLQTLPTNLTKLSINGPIFKDDLWSFSTRLQKLQEFNLILNTGGDRIDLDLFKSFMSLPNLRRFTAIQCPMDLDHVSKYCDTESTRELSLTIEGPVKIGDLPTLQYVIVVVGPFKQ